MEVWRHQRTYWTQTRVWVKNWIHYYYPMHAKNRSLNSGQCHWGAHVWCGTILGTSAANISKVDRWYIIGWIYENSDWFYVQSSFFLPQVELVKLEMFRRNAVKKCKQLNILHVLLCFFFENIYKFIIGNNSSRTRDACICGESMWI